MHRTRLRLVEGLFIACAVLLTGCGQEVTDPAVSAPSDGQPVTAGQPVHSCETPLGCSEFTSVHGTDATGDVAWLGTYPLKLTSAKFDGVWTLFVYTPCNYLQVAVSRDDDVLTPRWRMVSDRGCEGPTFSYQEWTEKLFDQPVTWKLDGGVLTLSNSHATIELRES
ncbi:hypothetical protein ACFRJ9_10585 [Paenarthrobacter sp. NPDC056912]|uniref:hypothetical protein n=1 Tax=Paenarthrobacter sp. NPDC056912 TaxID=3345965 RepID=UPI003672111F